MAGVLLAMSFVASGSTWQFYAAAAMAPLAFTFDVFDGHVARRTGRAGTWFDDLQILAGAERP